MSAKKWPNFLFTVVVRFVCGGVLGGLAFFLLAYRAVLRAFSRNDTQGPLLLLAVACVIGGLVAVWTTPRWQTPWYKGVRKIGDPEP